MIRPAVHLAALALALSPQVSQAREPVPYSDAAFATANREGGLVLVESWASWCLPCKIQAPIIARLGKQAQFRGMRVIRVGESTPPAVWQRFRLSGYGMIVVFRGGKEVARGTPTTEADLLGLLRRAG